MLKRTVDLSSCDSEPIHIIGGVQPNGALLAADARTGIVAFASDNQGDYFGKPAAELLGQPLSALFGEMQGQALLAESREPSQPEHLRPSFLDIGRSDGSSVAIECYPHRLKGRIVLDYVPREPGPANPWDDDLIRQRIISDLVRPDSLGDLASVAAGIIREVTGFDRVMIYRFAPDRHGEVIAESTIRPDSFLGLHYPASDIPDPARRHFALNLIRSIPDIRAVPVPIIGRSGGVADATSDDPLDLTFSKLRAVAPVHVEYLVNMGVGASLSISLIANGELWGLVACHHYGPLHLSWSRLRFCELLGGTISALLQSQENAVQLRHSIRAEKIAFAIEREARLGRPLAQVVLDHAGQLMAECDAQGMILKLGGRSTGIGKLPPGGWSPSDLSGALVDGISAFDQICGGGVADGATSTAPHGEIAGAAMLELSDDGEDWLVLFREEFEHTIRWAGKPVKRETALGDGTVRLSPRGSFALWREERRGRSRPFTATDAEILRITRRALFAMNSLDRERAAVAAKAEAEAAEMRMRLTLLDAARNRSLGELAAALAHELNQPLSAVSNYVNACRQELKNYGLAIPAHVSGLMQNAVTEASRAADLVRRLRDLIGSGEVAVEHADLHAVIRQGVDLAMAASQNVDATVRFRFDETLRPLLIDPVQIAQVILNLVRNSLTAMRDRNQRVLTITTRVHGEIAEVSVHDTGRGIDPSIHRTLFEPFRNSTTSGMGIGLSLCRSIVEAHGGKISVRPAEMGTEFVFTLKLAEECDE
ncbi:MAG: GAF domain-containing protein [Rhizobiaceae bacterium]|nr:GAF domain-containing protein [Rhizobiaceae bacterium]